MFDNDYWANLDHEHDDEDEDEHGVEVGDVEGGTEAADEGVAADNSGQQHGRRLRREVAHKATDRNKILNLYICCWDFLKILW